MNSIKYFNFNYLKENIKKSRGLILLLMIAVPFFTILSLVFICNSENYTKVIYEAQIAIPNVIGMYIIPFLLSFSLFGYIYKKSSVDFINSMPLNRKTIFITNTIGGILLITLLQLITLVVALLCNALVSTIVIFPAMLIDIFITMWIAYFFMFCATNLAMTLSGTALTQVVLTMIIIFIIPFCMLTFNSIIERENRKESDTKFYRNEVFLGFSTQTSTYTLPFNVISSKVGDLYSTVSNTKMMVLGIVYLVLGLYCFQNRKMENAEESFSSDKAHLFVKALTIFPMIVILNLLDEESGFNTFAIGLIVIYYFAYDFIIKRRVKFAVSVISLLITLAISQLIVLGVGNIKSEHTSIQREDIAKIAISLDTSYSDFNNNQDLFIDKAEIIDFIYNSSKELKDTKVTAYDKAIVENSNEIYIPEAILHANLILKNGKQLSGLISIKEEDIDELIEILEKDANYVENVKKEYMKKGVILIDNRVITEKGNQINEILEKEIQKMSLKEIYNMNQVTNNCLSKYYYSNHKLMAETVPMNIDEKVLQLVAENESEFLRENWEDIKKSTIHAINFTLDEGEFGYSSENFKTFNGYFSYTNNNIEKLIEDNINEKFDVNKQGYLIRFYAYPVDCTMYFFTNKVDEFNEIIKLEEEQIEIYEEKNNYNKDVVYNENFDNVY